MDTIKDLKNKLAEERYRRTKLMWQSAPVFWKFIIVFGLLALMYLFYLGFSSIFELV